MTVLDLGCIDDDPVNADWLLTINRAAAAEVASKSATDDPSSAAFLLIRALNENGKWRYLLQKRTDGTWGLPGGKLHAGEDAWDGAVREASEELGDLPEGLVPRLTLVSELGKSAGLSRPPSSLSPPTPPEPPHHPTHTPATEQ
jgi:8-oxo-dGTP pyrophosphatase MutT (NUDIX family)